MMPLHVHNQHVAGDVKRELDELVTDTGNWDGEIDEAVNRSVEYAEARHARANRARFLGGRR